MPGSPLDPRAEGTNDLLKQGATICTSVDDVLSALEPVLSRDLFSSLAEGRQRAPLSIEQSLFADEPGAAPSKPEENELSHQERAAQAGGDGSERRALILTLLGPSPISLDELTRAAEASSREVRIALLELELAGRLEYFGDRVALRAAPSDA